MKKLLFLVLFAPGCMPRGCSQATMADESRKQTELMEQQVHELKRIADALQKDSVKANPFIYSK